VEGQAEAFEAADLEFRLDERLLRDAEVVVFRGQLRFGEERTPAFVVYPPGFHLGEHPVVVAPELDIGRHRSPEGILCLDHVVLGESDPMSGAEAVERAERLWMLWTTDRAQLREEEADAPDPWSNYVRYTAGTAIAMVDADVAGGTRGYIHIGLTSLYPLRGSLLKLRITHPTSQTAAIPEDPNAVLRGSYELTGPWLRLSEHPPAANEAAVVEWLQRDHRALVERALRASQGLRGKQSDFPTLIGFVYPDEGPRRGETHDAWLFVLIRPDRQVELPQAFHLRTDERWLRQPHLAGLSSKRVAVVGAGALGSQVADLLARAGVSDFLVIDNDTVTPGNRIRHALDLSDIGHMKTHAIKERILRVNPWAKVEIVDARVGTLAIGSSGLEDLQRCDDTIARQLGTCDLIVNATANGTASSYLSTISAEFGKPALHTYVSAGAWGARLLLQRPRASGCWDCLAWWQAAPADERTVGIDVPDISEEHSREIVMERGCADPTFTGPGYELGATAASTARVAVGLLLDGSGYPSPDFDLATLIFRKGSVQRTGERYSALPPHPDCSTCRT
jgi:hypothetical protein